MIIILKKQAEEAKINALKKEMEEQGLGIHESEGVNTRILGLVGDTSVVDMRHIMANSIVENVQRIQEPYKKANRKFHPNDTVVDVNGVKIGGGNFQVIAGPCSIETKEQITEVANDVKNSGAGLLRGGAFKPRTSPYSFQGLHGEGLELLLEAKKATIRTLTEIHETAKSIMESADCAIGYEAANMVYKGAIGFKDDYIEHIMYHRCLSTLKQPVPCVSRCPARVDIPGYIALVREGRYEDAIRLIRQNEMVETLSYNENEIQAVFKGEREDEVMLLHELMAADIPVYSFGRDRSSLETLFMQITDREVKEHAHESGL